MHPFLPFLTEEIYHVLHNSGEESIMNSSMPASGDVDHAILDQFDFTRDLIISVRNVRAEKNIPRRNSFHCSSGRKRESMKIMFR